ncbi:A24 family peptidase [Modicisalibacter tunisiensis]|uniref:Prepilin peptidase n=1 Tax=Modicisalibacter tunisiensis TaxID=390637 RepID=A0ABS7WZD1_9GAMM|nr:A24 family peptidase [Modicisalibacter tunisiensis]MBZ9539055.1 prepilin peptidase [Modicisalibacter tunisiensis]MBZ9567548.1 prepilin peptidase [Modicisalibacter tunisiensis]
MQPSSLILAAPLALLLVSAVMWDLRKRRIPNLLIMAGAVVGILLQGLLAGHDGALAAIEGLGIGLIVLLPGYLAGFTGAGDVKLMAAIGTFLGPYSVFLAALASIAVGGADRPGLRRERTVFPYHHLALGTLRADAQDAGRYRPAGLPRACRG